MKEMAVTSQLAFKTNMLSRIDEKINIDRNSKSFKFKRNRLMCLKHLTASTICKLKTTRLNCSQYFNWTQWIRNNNTTTKKTRPKAERQNVAEMRSTICDYMQTTPSIRTTATTTDIVDSIIFSTIPHLRILCSKCDNRLICFKFTTLTFSIWYPNWHAIWYANKRKHISHSERNKQSFRIFLLLLLISFPTFYSSALNRI